MPSQLLKNVITSFLRMDEVDKLTAYRDSGGVWTIGDGHTGTDVHEGETITLEQDRELLEKDLEPLWAMLDGHQPPPTAPQCLSWSSFGYNCGRGALQEVWDGKAKIEHYIHDRQGNRLTHLVARRRFELALLGQDISVLD